MAIGIRVERIDSVAKKICGFYGVWNCKWWLKYQRRPKNFGIKGGKLMDFYFAALVDRDGDLPAGADRRKPWWSGLTKR